LLKIQLPFSGVSGFNESDIVQSFAFGMGTSPDKILFGIPEPATLIVLDLGRLILKK